MARPRNTVASTEWKVYIPSDLAAQVELILLDPMRNKVRHGARGKLIEKLLREWLEEQREAIQHEQRSF